MPIRPASRAPIPPASNLPAAALELVAAAAAAMPFALVVLDLDTDVVDEVEDADVVDDWERTVGAPPVRTLSAADELGEVVLDEGRGAALPLPPLLPPPTIAPIPHCTGPCAAV